MLYKAANVLNQKNKLRIVLISLCNKYIELDTSPPVLFLPLNRLDRNSITIMEIEDQNWPYFFKYLF